MQPRIKELLDYLDRERAGLDDAIATVPANRHRERPAPESWSVAETVEHLAIIDQRITTLIGRVVDEAIAGGMQADGMTDPVLPGINVDKVLDRSTKLRNPRADPTSNLSTAEGLKALDAARDNLKSLLGRPDLPDLGKVTAPHPAFGPLSGYEWIAFVAAHTHRHADQIREVGATLGV
jgi:hypothetical protein